MVRWLTSDSSSAIFCGFMLACLVVVAGIALELDVRSKYEVRVIDAEGQSSRVHVGYGKPGYEIDDMMLLIHHRQGDTVYRMNSGDSVLVQRVDDEG